MSCCRFPPQHCLIKAVAICAAVLWAATAAAQETSVQKPSTTATPASTAQASTVKTNPFRSSRLYVVCIGGMDSDPTPEQIAGTARRQKGNSGLFQLAGDLQRERIEADYFNWNGTRAGELKSSRPPLSKGIAATIREHLQQHPSDQVALVGNSWGGHTAWEVSQQLLQNEAPLAIDYMVFLDPSSTGRGTKPQTLPVNVNHAVQYFTRNVFVWGKWDVGTRLQNIDLGEKASGFLKPGGPPYQVPFSFPAHVAAEWDERIHEDIQNRLVDLLPEH